MQLACTPHPNHAAQRARTLKRNEAIYDAYHRGTSKKWLARRYRLKIATVKNIIWMTNTRRARERDG